MSPFDVALVTCRRLPEPDPDAAPVGRALDAAGLSWSMLPWDDPDADVGAARATVFRSCWNYPSHAAAFDAWVRDAAAATTLLNPAPVVRWNIHKRYLLELEAAGVPATPTEVVPRGATSTLADLLARRGWSDVVVKPAISAGSWRTMRVGAHNAAAGQQHFTALVGAGDTLVQPYLASVEDHGERALVWIAGELSHAVRKTPRWHGEDELVSTEAMPISDAEAAVALAAIKVAQRRGDLLYARVDIAPDARGAPVVMELELVEPSLFFAQGPAETLERYVAGIAARLQ